MQRCELLAQTTRIRCQGANWKGMRQEGATGEMRAQGDSELHTAQGRLTKTQVLTKIRPQQPQVRVRYFRGWLGGAPEQARVSAAVPDALCGIAALPHPA
jgi:hypothetical protein